MAKCIKHTSGKIKRVSDQIADERVSSGKYTYCSRSEWKAETRDKK